MEKGSGLGARQAGRAVIAVIVVIAVMVVTVLAVVTAIAQGFMFHNKRQLRALRVIDDEPPRLAGKRKHENSHADCTKMRHRQAQYEDWQEGDKPNGATREHRPLGKQDMHRRLQKELGEYQ